MESTKINRLKALIAEGENHEPNEQANLQVPLGTLPHR